jgi:UDP:flavonoid glycosyltransferase YjiC (YdhE family)
VISHAGPNTVLETLMHGKPLLALPMALDQPAVAARLAALGVAAVLPAENRSTEQLRTALLKVLNDPSYRNAAQKLHSQIQSLHGLERAADIIEEALSKRRNIAIQALDDFPLTTK